MVGALALIVGDFALMVGALGRISKLPKIPQMYPKFSVFSAAIGPRREISRPNGRIASNSEGLVPRPLSVISKFRRSLAEILVKSWRRYSRALALQRLATGGHFLAVAAAL